MKRQQKNKTDDNFKDKRHLFKDRLKYKQTLSEHARLIDAEPQEHPPAKNESSFSLSTLY